MIGRIENLPFSKVQKICSCQVGRGGQPGGTEALLLNSTPPQLVVLARLWIDQNVVHLMLHCKGGDASINENKPCLAMEMLNFQCSAC